MEQPTDEIQKPIVLHLLHGTWATGAEWTKPDSLLVKALKKEFFGDPVPMEWKGRNRDNDRRSAAEQVVAALEHKEGRHVLIAHSHGGNVALYAAADHRLHGKIAGIICLNTPFISIIRRDYTTRLALLALLAALAPVMWAAGVLQNRVEGIMEGVVVLGSVILLILALVSAIPLLRWFHEKGLSVWNRLAPTNVQDVPVLCISSSDDEVEYGLSMLEHVANLPTILQHPIIMMVLFFGCIAMQMTGLLPELSLSDVSPGTVYGTFMYVLSVFLFWQLIAILFSLVAGRIALGLGFSYWPLLYNFFVRVSVTPVPLYYRVVDFVDFVIPAAEKLSIYAHSRVYQDKRVVQQVVVWVKNGFALKSNG